MRVAGRSYRDEWLPNFYPSKEVAPDRWLRISRSGRSAILSGREDSALNDLFMDESLYRRLEHSGHIITASNAQRALEDVRTWQSPTYSGPLLHIVTVTKRCNLACTYCHMNPVPVAVASETADLTPETAGKIARFIMESPNPNIFVEFQGGEPFLNMAGARAVVSEIRRLQPASGKMVSFSLVSNMLSVKDADLQYCADNDVHISYTINGPAEVHNFYRRTVSGKETFAAVMDRVAAVRIAFPNLISATPLCVLDERTVADIEQIIDFYYDHEFTGMALIRLKPLGFARRNHRPLDPGRYMDGYLKGLSHILEKNRNPSRPFGERMVHVALAKLFSNIDVGYVDWRNPCGDVVGAIVYDWDGEILPADEARSMRAEFSLGNVYRDTYADIVSRPSSFRTANASVRDRHSACRECAYNPYCGVMPVIEYARTGKIDVLPHESEDCLFTIRFLDWLFAAFFADPLPLMRMIPNFDKIAGRLLDC
jgi:uncharacterized protein